MWQSTASSQTPNELSATGITKRISRAASLALFCSGRFWPEGPRGLALTVTRTVVVGVIVLLVVSCVSIQVHIGVLACAGVLLSVNR